MRRLEAIVVHVRRDYESCYALLSDPLNYPKWSPIPEPFFEPADSGGYAWHVELPRGRRIMHFTPRNAFGILDYSIFSEDGEHEYTARLRLIPNDEGSTLVALYLDRPDSSDEVFRSDVEWLTNDLRAVATAVEAM